MKVLFIFWDMARVNLINKYDSNNSVTPIDEFIDNIGGTLFTKCYTPAPDTPRSLACMQTGLYPYKNECDSRIKYPKFFLNEDRYTYFDLMEKSNFSQLFYIPKRNLDTGPFSKKVYDYGEFHHDKITFKRSLKNKLHDDKNLYAHIHLQDYHWCIDDYGANKKGARLGREYVADFTNDLLEDIDIDEFDYTFIVSDHGHKFKKDLKKEDKLLLLDGDRTNILMHLRKRGDNDFKVNKKLCSIIDLHPTFSEILNNDEVESDGISLLSNEEHDSVVIEDHSTFKVEPIQGITRWALRGKDYLYITDLRRHLYFKKNNYSEITNKNKSEIEDLIQDISPSINEYRKKLEVLDYYKTFKKPSETYSNGLKRFSKSKKKNYLNKLKSVVKGLIKE